MTLCDVSDNATVNTIVGVWIHAENLIPVANFTNMVLLLYPSMDKWLHPSQCVGWNVLSIPKIQRLHRWSLGMDKQFHPTFYQAYDYLSMLGLKLMHISKRGYWGLFDEHGWTGIRKWVNNHIHNYVTPIVIWAGINHLTYGLPSKWRHGWVIPPCFTCIY